MNAQLKPAARQSAIYSEEHENLRETRHRLEEEGELDYKLWEKHGTGTLAELWRKADAAITTDLMTNIPIVHDTHEQKLRWCPGVLAGKAIQGIGLTNAGGGSDVSGVQARARRDGDHWVLSVNTCYASSGSEANLVYFFVKTDADLKKCGGAITAFLVDAKTPGVKMRCMDTIRMLASGVGEGFFEDVRVPANCMLGNEGEALRAKANVHARSCDHRDARPGRRRTRAQPDARLHTESQGLRAFRARTPERALQARRDEDGTGRRGRVPRRPAAHCWMVHWIPHQPPRPSCGSARWNTGSPIPACSCTVAMATWTTARFPGSTPGRSSGRSTGALPRSRSRVSRVRCIETPAGFEDGITCPRPTPRNSMSIFRWSASLATTRWFS